MRDSGCLAAGLLIFSFYMGCGRAPETAPVEVERELQSPALLLSEVLTAPDRMQLVRCLTHMKNPNAHAVEVQLVGTGCACYGLVVDGRRLSPGDKVTLPAEAEAILEIAAQPPNTQTVKDYTADLRVLHPQTARNEQISMICQLQVYLDLRVTPNVVTFEVPSGSAQPLTRKLEIVSVFRGKPDEVASPKFEGLPPFAEIRNAARSGPDEVIAEDLRRQSWTADFMIDRAPDPLPDLPPEPFQVILQRSDGTERSRTECQLILQSPRPIAFPSRVYMGKIQAGEVRQRRILVTSTNGSPFRLEVDAGNLPAFLHVQVDPEPQRQHWIQLDVRPEAPGPFSGVFSLKTDQTDQPHLSITVSGDAEIPLTETSSDNGRP